MRYLTTSYREPVTPANQHFDLHHLWNWNHRLSPPTTTPARTATGDAHPTLCFVWSRKWVRILGLWFFEVTSLKSNFWVCVRLPIVGMQFLGVFLSIYVGWYPILRRFWEFGAFGILGIWFLKRYRPFLSFFFLSLLFFSSSPLFCHLR